mgnify:CR=1 FL=1
MWILKSQKNSFKALRVIFFINFCNKVKNPLLINKI